MHGCRVFAVRLMKVFLQAEQELRMTQSEFDRQAEITRLLLEGVSSTHVRSPPTHPFKGCQRADVFEQLRLDLMRFIPLFSPQAHHLRCLNDFVEAQTTYYAQCYQYMVDLQKQLGR